MTLAPRFWEDKPLNEMNTEEWEALCDGCAKCCLIKLEDEDDGEVYYTKIVCQYMDMDSCGCTEYARREVLVPTCVKLSPENVDMLPWMPSTCAYRLLSEGKALESWHPLVSGDKESVHRAGVSVKQRCLSEEYVHPDGWDEHIIHWVE